MNNLTFITSLNLEIETRKAILYLNEENIQEFLNILFPLIEALRTVLRNNVELTVETQTGLILFKTTNDLINKFLEFENIWNYSYSTWHSAFKSNKRNNSEYLNGEANKYYDIQHYFNKHDKLIKDMHLLSRVINEYIVELNKLYAFEKLKRNKFKYFLFNLFNFLKKLKY